MIQKTNKEKEKLVEENKELAKVKDELLYKIIKIQNEKDQINKENKELSKEYYKIKDENVKLIIDKKKCKNFAKRKEAGGSKE